MIFTVKWCFVSSGLETPLQGCGWKNVSVIKRFWQNVEWTGGNLKVSELYTVITECQICMLKYYVFNNFLLSFIQQEILMNLSKLFGPIFMEYKFYTGLLGYNMMDFLIWVLN